MTSTQDDHKSIRDEQPDALRDAKKRWREEEIAHYKAGRYEESLAAITELIRLDPTDARSYDSQGMTLSRLQRYDEALFAYQKAIELNPTDQDVYYNLGSIRWPSDRRTRPRHIAADG